MKKLPHLDKDIIFINYKGFTYEIEKYFYYTGNPPSKYSTTELDNDFFDRLEKMHREKRIDYILKKN